ncbi:hypothetical protein niasHT_010327 [Heterodera trifolii]|uniref:Uncharacterized protein n=1 Tax=Heterodera trifolii TaxID=157864 RepID=A0ABD2M5Z9_9BILA
MQIVPSAHSKWSRQSVGLGTPTKGRGEKPFAILPRGSSSLGFGSVVECAQREGEDNGGTMAEDSRQRAAPGAKEKHRPGAKSDHPKAKPSHRAFEGRSGDNYQSRHGNRMTCSVSFTFTYFTLNLCFLCQFHNVFAVFAQFANPSPMGQIQIQKMGGGGRMPGGERRRRKEEEEDGRWRMVVKGSSQWTKAAAEGKVISRKGRTNDGKSISSSKIIELISERGRDWIRAAEEDRLVIRTIDH